MYKFLIVFFMILIGFFIFNKSKKYFCIFVGIILSFMLAMRSIKIGISDTENIYYPFFLKLKECSIIDIFYDKNLQDFGFFIVFKILQTITNNYQICIGVFATIYISLVMFFIYKNSNDAFISSIIFISLYFLYGTYLLRQVIAMGIILFSYKYIRDKNLKGFVLVVVMAALFHRTALIFLLAYPFCNFNKFGYKNYLYVLIALLISKYLFVNILKYLPYFDFTGKVQMALSYNIYTINSGEASLGGMYIDLAIMLMGNIIYNRDNRNEEFNILMNLLTLSAIFFTFINVIAEFYRVSLYFGIFSIILIPYILEKVPEDKLRRNIKCLIIFIFILYFFYRPLNTINCNPYLFFWEV